MKKTILIGALLLGTLAQANMDKCNEASKMMIMSLDRGIEAYNNKDFKGACIDVQLVTSFAKHAMASCPAELQASLQKIYIHGKQTEAIVCNLK